MEIMAKQYSEGFHKTSDVVLEGNNVGCLFVVLENCSFSISVISFLNFQTWETCLLEKFKRNMYN